MWQCLNIRGWFTLNINLTFDSLNSINGWNKIVFLLHAADAVILLQIAKVPFVKSQIFYWKWIEKNSGSSFLCWNASSLKSAQQQEVQSLYIFSVWYRKEV